MIKLLSPGEVDSKSILNYSVNELKEALLMLFKEGNNQFLKIATECLANSKHENIGSLLYELAFLSMNKQYDIDVAIRLFYEIYHNKDNSEYGITEDNFYNSLRFVTYLKPPEKDAKVVIEYIKYFQNKNNKNIDFIDIENFANYIFWLFKKKNYEEALKIIELVKSLKKDVSEEYLINYIVIYNLELNIHNTLSNEAQIKETAGRILEMANDSKISKYQSNILGKEGLSVIKSNAESALMPKYKKIEPIKKSKKPGRNDMVKVKYKDGEVKVVKYKKVENDLNNNLCELID